MPGRVNLTVEAATPKDRGAVSNLLQLYLHDFSEIDDGIEIDQNGLFPCADFDTYWSSDPTRKIFVFRLGGALAGFAFVNDWSPSGQGVDYGLAEFFVLRSHRRSGVGWDAANQVFASLPGQWEVAVRASNVPAINFWRTALRDDNIRALTEITGDGARWDGNIFRFESDTSD